MKRMQEIASEWSTHLAVRKEAYLGRLASMKWVCSALTALVSFTAAMAHAADQAPHSISHLLPL